MISSEVHIHTLYADGKDTPEEMVKAAIEKGYTLLGFSEHAPMKDGRTWPMKWEASPLYRAEIRALSEKYKDRITILCGIEQDSFAGLPEPGYDYVIGSVHGVLKGGKIWDVDESIDQMKEMIALFGGDPLNLAEAYFEEVSKVLDKTHGDIIGHFDLLTKWEEVHPFFNTAHPRYRAAAEEAIKALIPFSVPFEVNTGAIARGYRTEAYPEDFILRSIFERGGSVMLNSDCHDASKLGIGFEAALKRICTAGFTRLTLRTKSGFDYMDI